MSLSRRRSIAIALATTTLFGLVSIGTAEQASAATVYTDNNGYPSQEGDFYLTYNSNDAGAAAWFYGDVPDYAGTGVYSGGTGSQTVVYVFQQNGGSGQGQAVKNNAAYGENSDLADSYTVYYNSSYEGASEVYYPVDYGFYEGNLDSTLKNNEASQYRRTYV